MLKTCDAIYQKHLGVHSEIMKKTPIHVRTCDLARVKLHETMAHLSNRLIKKNENGITKKALYLAL